MALITISGYPCSGKSTRASQIHSYIHSHLSSSYSSTLKNVITLSDDALDVPRSVYDSSKTEKTARATLFTHLQRELNSSTVVIVDSGNYIKGFRYQMYCAAREAGVRVATVYTAASPEVCRERYLKLDPSSTYSQSTFENLIMRYEEPSSMARWDSPLFTIPPDDPESALPLEEIWRAITQGDVKPPNAGTVAAVSVPTDALQILDHTTSSIVQSIIAEQRNSGIQGGAISLPLLGHVVTLPMRGITLPELQRHKRQFVNTHRKAITLGSTEKGAVGFDEKSVGERFCTYLETHLV